VKKRHKTTTNCRSSPRPPDSSRLLPGWGRTLAASGSTREPGGARIPDGAVVYRVILHAVAAGYLSTKDGDSLPDVLEEVARVSS
jgi:hypothetical protein